MSYHEKVDGVLSVRSVRPTLVKRDRDIKLDVALLHLPRVESSSLSPAAHTARVRLGL